MRIFIVYEFFKLLRSKKIAIGQETVDEIEILRVV